MCIREIAQLISQVNENSTSISSAGDQQAATTREVSSNINGVTTAAQESGASSRSVLETAQHLSTEAGGLGEKVDDFLAKVRAM